MGRWLLCRDGYPQRSEIQIIDERKKDLKETSSRKKTHTIKESIMTMLHKHWN